MTRALQVVALILGLAAPAAAQSCYSQSYVPQSYAPESYAPPSNAYALPPASAPRVLEPAPQAQSRYDLDIRLRSRAPAVAYEAVPRARIAPLPGYAPDLGYGYVVPTPTVAAPVFTTPYGGGGRWRVRRSVRYGGRMRASSFAAPAPLATCGPWGCR